MLAHELLHGTDWRMKLAAVKALRPLTDPGAVPALIHALGDKLLAGTTLGDSSAFGTTP